MHATLKEAMKQCLIYNIYDISSMYRMEQVRIEHEESKKEGVHHGDLANEGDATLL